jgi:hypothetical protein
MNVQDAIKKFSGFGINDDKMRKFTCWGSVEVVDRQREIIPIEEVYKIMDIWMDRGAPIMFIHTNRQVGKGLSWRPELKDGKEGVLITGIIFNHYKEDDEVWNGIKNGEFEGLSIGGNSYSKEKDANGNTVIRDLIGYEFSVVPRTGNQEATFQEVNAMAKSDTTNKADEPVMEETPKAPEKAPEPAADAKEPEKAPEPAAETKAPDPAPEPEQPQTPALQEQVSKLESTVASLVEKLAQIEEKISGKPETETPIEGVPTEEKSDEQPKPCDEEKSCDEQPKPTTEEKSDEEKPKPDESNDKEKDVQKSELESVKKELADLKKSIVAKTIETPRPAEVQKRDKHNEARAKLQEMSRNGSIDFQELRKAIQE